MKRICSWCRRNIGAPDSRNDPDDAIITHGICPDCVRQVCTHKKEDLSRYLDHFDFPVFLVDSDVEIITANQQGFSALRKRPEEVEGRRGGDAFDCRYAALPGGCGKTIHCKSCAIRLTVADTYKTGKGHEKVPAFPDLDFLTGESRIRFLISTEKRGDAVLLRIDEIMEEK
jgi:hypothetical protein